MNSWASRAVGWARTGLARLRATAWSIGQCAIGAMLAWLVATGLLAHSRPFFAPVAAVVCLNVSQVARLRRVGELAIGVTIGVGIADLLVREIGNGWWQIGLVVVLATGTAQLFGGGPLATAQAGVQAIFLVALPQVHGTGLQRWEDALIGGSCALLVAVLLPSDPSRAVKARAELLIAELAVVIADAAEALRDGRADLADATLERARRTQVDVELWTEALLGGEETSRISPLRRRHRGDLARHRTALIGVDRAARNIRVAIRRIAAVLDAGQRLSPALADVLDELAGILRTLQKEVGCRPGDSVCEPVLEQLAARLSPAALAAHTMSEHVIVAQVRSAVVDLLGAVGTDAVLARALLPPADESGPVRETPTGPAS